MLSDLSTSAEKPSYGVGKLALLALGASATNMAPVKNFTDGIGAHVSSICVLMACHMANASSKYMLALTCHVGAMPPIRFFLYKKNMQLGNRSTNLRYYYINYHRCSTVKYYINLT